MLLSLPTEPQQCCHCPGKLNPANDGSHSLEADTITPNCCWFKGTAYLLLSEDQEPEDIPRSKFAPGLTMYQLKPSYQL